MHNAFRRNIRFQIYESLYTPILQEGVQIFREINELAVEVCRYLGEREFKNIQNLAEHGKIENHYMWPVIFNNDFREYLKKDYKTIRDFIDNTTVVISFKFSNTSSSKGYYRREINEKGFNKFKDRNITIFLRQELQTEIIEKSLSENKDSFDVFSTLYYAIASTLAHELQHVYDDYRSKSKIFSTPQAKHYFNNVYDKETGNFTRNNHNLETPEGISSYNKDVNAYRNQPHEVWARFTQAMARIHFSILDWDAYEKTNREVYKMKPLKDVVTELKIYYEGWYQLPEAYKNRLLNKILSSYYEEAEELKEKNKNYQSHNQQIA